MAIKTYSKGSKTQLSTNFKAYEFDCNGSNCCSKTKIDEKLVSILQKIRNHFKKSVKINSAYRCSTYNKKVGGASSSNHIKGMAADIVVDGIKPKEVAKYAESIGVLGIGLYETDKDGYFVHIDTRTKKAFWYGQAQKKVDTFGGSTPKKANEKKTTANTKIKEWQKAAKADGFKITVDGIWGTKSTEIAKQAVCKNRDGVYKYKNLTKLIQKEMGYTGKDVDGKFGSGTEKKVKSWQKKKGLTADGEFGYNSWKKYLNIK